MIAGRSTDSKTNPSDPQRPSDQEVVIPDENGLSLQEDAIQPQKDVSIEARGASTCSTSPDPHTSGSIQILGLESQEPIISYQGQVYRCSWGTTLGTDLIFTEPENVPHDVEPLLQEPTFNLLATTNIKLIAATVEVTEKVQEGDVVEERESAGAEPNQHLGETSLEKPEKPYSILLEERATESRKRQAEFLEELMAIKAARSETDKVYIGKGKKYQVQGDANPRDGPALSLEAGADNAEEDDQPEASQVATEGPPKKRVYRRKAGRPRGRGGKATSTGRGPFRGLTEGEGEARDAVQTGSENVADVAAASQIAAQDNDRQLEEGNQPQDEQIDFQPQAMFGKLVMPRVNQGRKARKSMDE